MEVSKEDDSLVLLDRASRATRGKRMTKLIDDELEEDELFWNQEALKDEEDDDNYQEETEVVDEFDSDFDEDEPEPDEAEKEVEERPQNKKRLIFPGKTLPKKKTKKKDLSKLDKLSMNEKSTEQPATPDHQDAPDDVEGERIVRKSTRTSVIVRQAERDAIRAALQATMKPIKRKKEGEEKRMTQEEMLLEAAQTEIVNLRNLERVLAREEEVKKRAIVHKAVYSCSYLEFKGLSFQSQLSTTSVPYQEKAICAVTGLPAKYRDPKTGLPYATKEAFKIIRERFMDENNNIKKMAMGDLFDSLVGTGFHGKRKRLPTSNRRKMSHLSRFANFGMTSIVDIESSE
ncbi:SWR1 complex subunit 2 [Populus alba x Populus x berolinensis]|uniref:SWR1 complex subunit 2 n=1 Tax=Populus alba x Populus x berolinensis TaxID=444605 RepID=A0AAD6QS53_9ROSI|nr:SWR1 complex subunit 2 [Populus alba x Populus x berolinensis]